MKIWYRVNNINSQQGLWYTFNGEFTGLTHNEYSFCSNSQLKMDFDPELVGYISAVETLEDLFKWFTKEDILKLQEHGYRIHAYECNQFKFYDRFQHPVINQETAKLKAMYVIDTDHKVRVVYKSHIE